MTFEVITTTVVDEAGMGWEMYGLKTHCGELFESICEHKSYVQQMAQVLNDSDLAPEHQRDLLEDMVQQLYII